VQSSSDDKNAVIVEKAELEILLQAPTLDNQKGNVTAAKVAESQGIVTGEHGWQLA
jgi:hypothetical protein